MNLPGFRRRQFVLSLIGAGFAARGSCEVASALAARTHPIVILASGHNEVSTYQSFESSLRESLPELAPRMVFILREASFSDERLASQIEEVLSLHPTIIICMDLNAALRTVERRSGETPPLVFIGHDDPIAYKLIESYARPGRNLTGVTTFRCVDGKMIEIMAEAFPNRQRVGYFQDSTVDDTQCARLAYEAARRAGIRLISVDVSAPDFVPKIEKKLAQLHLDAAVAPASWPIWQNRHAVVAGISALKIPAIYESELFLSEGGLLSYGPLRSQTIPQVVTDVSKILRGEPAGEIPVEQPTLFELCVNLRAPHAAEFAIKPSILRRADRVMQ